MFYEVTTYAIPGVPRGTVFCALCENGGVDPKFHLCDMGWSERNSLGKALRRWCEANGYVREALEVERG